MRYIKSKRGEKMKSLIDMLYHAHFSGAPVPKDIHTEKILDWERGTMFYTGFCMGARLMMEILTSPDFE